MKPPFSSRARPMGFFQVDRGHPEEGRFPGPRGPLSGRRVLIRPDSFHLRAGETGTLTYGYMNEGSYYVRLDGLPVETVCQRWQWELLEEAA